jgi:hypothetical protein
MEAGAFGSSKRFSYQLEAGCSLKTEYLATIVIRDINKCAVRRTVSLLELRLE